MSGAAHVAWHRCGKNSYRVASVLGGPRHRRFLWTGEEEDKTRQAPGDEHFLASRVVEPKDDDAANLRKVARARGGAAPIARALKTFKAAESGEVGGEPDDDVKRDGDAGGAQHSDSEQSETGAGRGEEGDDDDESESESDSQDEPRGEASDSSSCDDSQCPKKLGKRYAHPSGGGAPPPAKRGRPPPRDRVGAGAPVPKPKVDLLPSGPLPRINLGPDEHFIDEPTWEREGEPERRFGYIFGGPGAGKSSFMFNYAGRYRALHPDREILYISALKDDDPSLPCNVPPTNIKRVKLNTLLDNPMDGERELKNKLILVDDIENIQPKALETAIRQMVNEVATRGRKWHASLLIGSHVPADYNKTKLALLSADTLTWFPNFTNKRNVKYVLTNYGNMDAEEAETAMRQRSRWITLHKRGNRVVLGDGIAYSVTHGDGAVPVKAAKK